MTEPNSPSDKSSGYRPYRSQHRARHHQSAHEDSASASAQAIPGHPLISQASAILVTTSESLNDILAHIREVGRFAYDSEFIGELTYLPKLCLLQVATHERVALIDPLADLELRPFWELVADPSIEKIVHAGQQDLEPVIRHLDREPVNVFDTQIAAGFIGMAYPVALSKLAREMVGANMGKGLTFTHWDHRPLSNQQLRYAADDVRYLPAIRDQISQRLQAAGTTPWAQQECASLCEASLYRFDADVQCRRVRGANSMNPAELAILRELVIWRNDAAKAHDLPPRAFLKDEVLTDLVRTPVRHVEKLAKVRGLPRPVEQAHGKQIVDAIARGLAVPSSRSPAARSTEESPTERFRADALFASAECLSIGRGVDPSLVTSRQEIGELYRYLTRGGDEPDIRLLRGWRLDAVGKPLMDLFRGESTLRINWSQGSLRAQID